MIERVIEQSDDVIRTTDWKQQPSCGMLEADDDSRLGLPMTVDATEETARTIAARYGNRPDTLIEILHEVQARHGHVPEGVIPALADALNLSRAEVYGVVTFYHDFRREPPGRHVLKVCRAEACQAMGAEALLSRAEDRLGIACGGTTSDGRLTLAPVYCLGLCAIAPSAMLDGRLIGRVTPAALDALLKDAGA